MRYLYPMEDANSLVYRMRDLNQNTARVMHEIREAGKPAFITSYGRFIAVIQPLDPGQVEQQALAAIARQVEARTTNPQIRATLRQARTTETTQAPEETK